MSTPPNAVDAARARIPQVGIPLAVVGIVVVMVVPLPTGLVDLLLAGSISVAVLVLLTAMLVDEPLQFSVFPSLLLVTTLFRLALNVSTTRLILRDGFAGEVIDAFGGFVVSGNIVIGLVVFAILIVIQFAVITNGSGRVAEVAARFTLDAMPGKQMAIDADLNAGLITEDEARARREHIAREADFYGAMDGASKFVKGDAIAGVVIVLINLLGGITVGVVQDGRSLGEAISRYALLSVGDGLVSQIPALLISVAAGIVVTRVVSDDAAGGLGADLWIQLLRSRQVLAIAAAVLAALGLLPGLPALPFLALAAAVGVAALRRPRRPAAADTEVIDVSDPQPTTREGLLREIRVEPLELELAADLFDLVDPAAGGNLLDRVKALRRQIAHELGIVVPLVRTRDNVTLPPSTYVIRVHGVEVGRGEAPPGQVLVLADGDPAALPGRPTTEPVFGLPAAWVPEHLAATMEAEGHTVVDRASVLVTHLSEVVRTHAAELVSRDDVAALVEAVREVAPAVASEVGGEHLTLVELQGVLAGLLAEGVPVRDLVRIIEAVSARARTSRDPEHLLEAARQALSAAICSQLAPDGILSVLTLDPVLEHRLLEHLRHGEHGSYLALDATTTELLLDRVGDAVRAAEQSGRPAVLACSQQLRPALRRLVGASHPRLAVVSYAELSRNITIQTQGVISIADAATPTG